MWKTTSALWAASTGTMSNAVDALKYINVNKKGGRACDTFVTRVPALGELSFLVFGDIGMGLVMALCIISACSLLKKRHGLTSEVPALVLDKKYTDVFASLVFDDMSSWM